MRSIMPERAQIIYLCLDYCSSRTDWSQSLLMAGFLDRTTLVDFIRMLYNWHNKGSSLWFSKTNDFPDVPQIWKYSSEEASLHNSSAVHSCTSCRIMTPLELFFAALLTPRLLSKCFPLNVGTDTPTRTWCFYEASSALVANFAVGDGFGPYRTFFPTTPDLIPLKTVPSGAAFSGAIFQQGKLSECKVIMGRHLVEVIIVHT